MRHGPVELSGVVLIATACGGLTYAPRPAPDRPPLVSTPHLCAASLACDGELPGLEVVGDESVYGVQAWLLDRDAGRSEVHALAEIDVTGGCGERVWRGAIASGDAPPPLACADVDVVVLVAFGGDGTGADCVLLGEETDTPPEELAANAAVPWWFASVMLSCRHSEQ